MKLSLKITLSCVVLFIVIFIAVLVGSTYVSPLKIFNILGNKLFHIPLMDTVSKIDVSIITKLRLPRTLMAFIVGAAIAVSGSVMQSVLKNPLASSYTLGVSSGASLGAGIVMMYAMTALGTFTLPIVGMVCGVGTVILSVMFAAKMDKNMSNNTIILVGMVFSLFINAIITIINSISRDTMQKLMFWQMGSFSNTDYLKVGILAALVAIGVAILWSKSRELDIMTFGENDASTIGVEVKKVKWVLLCTAAALTGSAISFVGVIGFVDLIAPHVVRKIYGAKHRLVIPMSALFGGIFMIVCDILARVIMAPSELPVGAITALVGAPFFAYVFFKRRRPKGDKEN